MSFDKATKTLVNKINSYLPGRQPGPSTIEAFCTFVWGNDYHAILRFNTEIQRMVVDGKLLRGPDEMLLVVAAADGDVAKINQLLKSGAKINFTDSDGSTALHYAAAKGNAKLVTHLIINGADSRVINHLGERARDLASDEIKEIFDNPPAVTYSSLAKFNEGTQSAPGPLLGEQYKVSERSIAYMYYFGYKNTSFEDLSRPRVLGSNGEPEQSSEEPERAKQDFSMPVSKLIYEEGLLESEDDGFDKARANRWIHLPANNVS
jgi:hypothetical protein